MCQIFNSCYFIVLVFNSNAYLCSPDVVRSLARSVHSRTLRYWMDYDFRMDQRLY